MIPKILDKMGVEFGLLPDLTEGYVVEERNGQFELEATYPIFCRNWTKLERGNIIVADANDTLKAQKFRIYNVSKVFAGLIKVYARHISFDLARDIIEEIELTNASCEYALNTLFRNSQFSQHFVGKSDIINAQDFKISNVNVLSAIAGAKGSIVDTYGTGAEILRDNTTISVLNKRGHDNGVTIEYSKNMTGLDITLDDSNLITRIKAYAKYSNEANEEVIVNSSPKYVDSPSIDNYETPFIQEIDFSDKFKDKEIPTPAKLKILADKYFLENKCDLIKENIKVEFIPLSKCLGYENIQDKISLCDTVRIIDSRYNLDTKAKVIKATYNVLTERYEKMELGEPRTSLNDIIGGGNSGVIVGGDSTNKPPLVGDSNFPNTLPTTPVLTNTLYGFDRIGLAWTFEAKSYYSYELYASKEKDFKPNSFDLIHSGNTSSYLFQAKPNETWYFRVCAINTHGKRTAFSNQVAVTTVKIDDLENYVSSAAIGDVLIGELNLGRGWVGQLNAQLLDVKGNFSVTDGNGKRTLDVDSFGNITLLPTIFKLLVNGKEESVATNTTVTNNLAESKVYAELVAQSESELAQIEAEAYADGIVTAEEQARIHEARKNLETAIQAAKDAETNANNHTNSEIKTVDKKIVDMNVDLEGVSIKVSKQQEQIVSIDGQVKDKITVAEAETIIDQKADNILIQASRSGGGNLVDNSGFNAGKVGWANYEYAWENRSFGIDVWSDSNEWILQGTKAICIHCKGHEEAGELGFEQRVAVKQNQSYTISCLMARHRADGGLHIYDVDTWEWIGNDNILESEPYNAGKDINGWKLVKVTFNSGSRNYVGIRFKMTKSSNDGHIWVCQPMLNEGTLAQPWQEKTLDATNLVSTINVSPEAIKIKSDKIQLEGAVTAGTGGRQVKINNGDYAAIFEGIERMFWGFRDFENSYKVPKFYMGAYGFNSNEHNYFGMTSYRGNGDNPEGSNYAYHDLSYRCINSNFKDWSNIKMYSSGRIKAAAVENFEITTNYLKGVYAGIEERRLALFATSTNPYFNSNLQIGCVRNMANEMGMILADDSVAGAETRVRCHTDSNRQKFFRVCDNVGDIGLGSTSFPWKNVVAKTNLIVDNLIVNPTKTSIMTSENALDNIDFIQTMNIDEAIKMDVSKIVGSNYAPRVSDGYNSDVAIDTVELLKLALMEIKKLKEEVKILKAR